MSRRQHEPRSPEYRGDSFKRHPLTACAYHYLSPLIVPLLLWCKSLLWRNHADPRSIAWEWQSIHFNRIALINLVLRRFPAARYLEIGCGQNVLFDSVYAVDKTGVDPLSGGTIRATSSAFFAENKKQFDVIFIDGLHTYQQVHEDINNALMIVSIPGWIIIHDMLPRNWKEEHYPVLTRGAWTGSVWKVAHEAMAARGVEFKIVRIDHGVGCIKVLQRTQLPDYRERLLSQGFGDFFNTLHTFPIVEWSEAQEWLQA